MTLLDPLLDESRFARVGGGVQIRLLFLGEATIEQARLFNAE